MTAAFAPLARNRFSLGQAACNGEPLRPSISRRVLTRATDRGSDSLPLLILVYYRFQELPWLLRQLLDVDDENNLPTRYSGFLLPIARVSPWLCAGARRADGYRWYRPRAGR